MSAVLTGAVAAPAAAQSGFAGAAVGTAILRFPHQSSASPSTYTSDTSGEVRAWSVIGGGTLARHGVLQAEFSSTHELTTAIPPAQYNPPCQGCGVTSTTVRYRSREFAVLGGYTTGQWRRVSLSALGGVIFVGRSTRIVSQYTPAPPVPPSPIPPSDTTVTQYAIGPAFGLDVPIVPWRHLQVVPQVRLYKLSAEAVFSGLPGPLVTTVSIGARWTF